MMVPNDVTNAINDVKRNETNHVTIWPKMEKKTVSKMYEHHKFNNKVFLEENKRKWQ